MSKQEMRQQEMCQRLELKNIETDNYDYAYEEAIKTLRTNVSFCGNNVNVVMVTSSFPREGKSSITFALAKSFAQTGKKTLLIDGDIRKSVLVSRFQLAEEVCGLSQFLSGQKLREEVVYSTNVEDLDIIFAGPFPPNPAELFEESLFDGLIQWARTEYEYVIIDTPPLTMAIDAAIIAKKCDGAALVIESGMISYRVVQKVKQQLEKSGCRILGVVLDKTDDEQSGYYGRYGYNGSRGGYGRRYGDRHPGMEDGAERSEH